MEEVKLWLGTRAGRVSFTLWIVLSVFFFAFFILVSKESLNSQGFMVRKVTEQGTNMGHFPAFLLCPQFDGGKIVDILCTIQEGKTKDHPADPPLTPLPVKPNPNDNTYVCYGFNLNEKADIGNRTVRCQVNATNTAVANSKEGVIAYFYPTDGKLFNENLFTDCQGCVEPQNSWILPPLYWSHVGIEKIRINHGEKYKVSGESFTTGPGEPAGSDIQAFFFWNTRDVWHYENFNYFNFWHWMGLVGGAAFLIKLLHDFFYFLIVIVVLRESPPDRSANQTYQAIPH